MDPHHPSTQKPQRNSPPTQLVLRDARCYLSECCALCAPVGYRLRAGAPGVGVSSVPPWVLDRTDCGTDSDHSVGLARPAVRQRRALAWHLHALDGTPVQGTSWDIVHSTFLKSKRLTEQPQLTVMQLRRIYWAIDFCSTQSGVAAYCLLLLQIAHLCSLRHKYGIGILFCCL